MFWTLNELSSQWTLAFCLFSLVSIVSIGYLKFNNSFADSTQLVDYFKSLHLVKKLKAKFNENWPLQVTINDDNQLNSMDTNKKYSTFKMTSLERKQSFIKRSLDGRRKHQPQTDQNESFSYSTIFSFTKTLMNRVPKSMTTSSTKKATAQRQNLVEQVNQPTVSNQFSTEMSSNVSSLTSHDHGKSIKANKFPLLHSTMSSMKTMSTLNEHEIGDEYLQPIKTNLTKTVSLQIGIEEMKPTARNRLIHQSSSGSSNSSTPGDLFSMAEKGRIGTSVLRNKPLVNNNKVYQEPVYTELMTQISNHEDAINREYLMHQLNPNQYHSMHYYRRLERQNCLNGTAAKTTVKKSKNNKTITKQDTVQSSSSNTENNLNELEHFTSSSSNLSCSECGSACELDTEEELTIPFMKKSGHHQSNVMLRAKRPLKLSSSLEKNSINNTLSNLTKQCSSDSNEAMVGLLNENLIKRQLANGTYLKLKNDRLGDKRKRILGRRLTAQNSFSAGSSFNNSSSNSSFDHDDMLVQFTSHHGHSMSSTDVPFQYNHHYENNSIHSNDTSSSSNSSCGHRHAERNKSLNLNEFHSLNLCDSNQMDQIDQLDKNCDLVGREAYQNTMLHVTHAFDPTTKKLKIRIVKSEYVPMKLSTDCDRFYIKIVLLPNRRHKFKTTIKQCSSTSSIEFDELFTYNRISPETIMSLSVKYMFVLVDNKSKHRTIGEAIVRFEQRKPMQQEDNLIVYLKPINIITTIATTMSPKCDYNVISSSKTHQLTNKSNTANESFHESLSDDVSSICRSDSAESHRSIQINLPELLIGLAYNAVTGRLQVSIIRGSQFKAKSNKPPDTYVKCTLVSLNGSEIGRNKTTVKRCQPNPVFKQTFAFQVALFQLPDVNLMISVYNKKSMNRKELIGWFSLGCSSSGEEENSHWNEMRDSKGEQICRWHVLSDS